MKIIIGGGEGACSVRSTSLGVDMGLYGRVVISTVRHGPEPLSMKEKEQ